VGQERPGRGFVSVVDVRDGAPARAFAAAFECSQARGDDVENDRLNCNA
jgi:hypothetical protein